MLVQYYTDKQCFQYYKYETGRDAKSAEEARAFVKGMEKIVGILNFAGSQNYKKKTMQRSRRATCINTLGILRTNSK